MTTYRVTANLSGNTDDKFKADIEADNEDQAWAIAYKSQLPRGIYNGKVEELPTRAELLARITALETACLPIKNQLAFVFETDADEKTLKLTMTAKECRTLAALLNNPPLEKE